MNWTITLALQQFEFESLRYLWLIFLMPALVLIYCYGFYRKRQMLNKFALPETVRSIAASANRRLQISKAAMLLIVVLLIMVALMRPRGNPTEQQTTRRGRDVCFLLDVSNSMLAEDLKPNRLERAKLAINDVIDIIEGDRVSLIIFAGSVALKSPLTSDYNFFKTILNKVSPKDIGQGGTNIGDAIRQAVDRVLPREDTKYKDIILISDGEDLEDSFPTQAAEYATQNGIRIHTVGLGDPEGTPIPDPDHTGHYLQHNNEIVMSRLDERTLRKIAAATPGGTYIPVRTGTMDLGELYRKVIAPAEKQQYESEVKIKWTEWFQVPLLAAVILLIAEWFIGERRKRVAANTLPTVLVIIISMASMQPAYSADSGSRLVKQGNDLYEKEQYDQSLEKYELAKDFSRESPEIKFNMANVYYQQQDYDHAAELYSEVLTNPETNSELDIKTLYNLGNCTLKQGERLQNSKPEESLKKYRDSIQFYRDTIEKGKTLNTTGDKSHDEVEDAKHNIEIAKLHIKQLREKLQQQEKQEQQEQEQKEKQEQQQQDLRDKLKEAIEKQKELEKKTEQAQEEKESDPDKDMSQQSQQIRQEQDENMQRTDELSKELADMKQQMDESQQSNPEQQEKLQKAKQHLDDSVEEQQSASDNLDEQNLEEAKQKQSEARESLEKALEELQNNQPEQGKQKEDETKDQQDQKGQEQKDQQAQQEKQRKKEGEILPDEAKQKLEEMRARFRKEREDREQELRKNRIRIIDSAGRIPVKKDW